MKSFVQLMHYVENGGVDVTYNLETENKKRDQSCFKNEKTQ